LRSHVSVQENVEATYSVLLTYDAVKELIISSPVRPVHAQAWNFNSPKINLQLSLYQRVYLLSLKIMQYLWAVDQ